MDPAVTEKVNKLLANLVSDKPEPDNNVPVFVYGSLMSGLLNNGIMVEGGADYGGMMTTEEKVIMTSLGAFPGMILDHFMSAPLYNKWRMTTNFTHALGEVWWCSPDLVLALDRLEGTPDFYRRVPARVRPWRSDNQTAIESNRRIHNNSSNTAFSIMPGSCWTYILGDAYFQDDAVMLSPLDGVSVTGILYWKYHVDGTRPPAARTIL